MKTYVVSVGANYTVISGNANNLYGGNLTVQPRFLSTGARGVWLNYLAPLSNGKVRLFYVYTQGDALTGIVPQNQLVYLQIWRPAVNGTSSRTYQLVYSLLVSLGLYAVSGGSLLTVRKHFDVLLYLNECHTIPSRIALFRHATSTELIIDVFSDSNWPSSRSWIR